MIELGESIQYNPSNQFTPPGKINAPIPSEGKNFCVYCGQKIDNDAAFCPNCGSKLL